MRLRPPFDSEAAVTLLRRWIAAFEIPALVEAIPAGEASFVFRMRVTEDYYFRAMTVPVSAGWMWNQTLVGSLGRLFKEIGKFNGVKISLKVAHL